MKKIDGWTQRYLEYVLLRGGRIEIVSGEGEGPGTSEPHSGRRTIRAIKARLKRESASGYGWAYALIETLDKKKVDGYAVKWHGGNGLVDAIISHSRDDDVA